MRAVVQRVSRARVVIDDEVAAEIGRGLLVLLGITHADTAENARWLAEKIVDLRIFPDDEGKMNRSVRDVGAEVLIISQFTLSADCRRGRRPSFDNAAPPEVARSMYETFVETLKAMELPVQTGEFRAMMQVELINDGPVTILLDSRKNF